MGSRLNCFIKTISVQLLAMSVTSLVAQAEGTAFDVKKSSIPVSISDRPSKKPLNKTHDLAVRNLDKKNLQKIEKLSTEFVKAVGGDSGGGGGMVLVHEGQVRFADLVTSNEAFYQSLLKAGPGAYSQAIDEDFYKTDELVTSFGKKKNFLDVFQNSLKNMLEASDQLPFVLDIIGSRCGMNTPVFWYHSRISLRSQAGSVEDVYSSRFPIWAQEPAAYFYGEGIIVSGTLVERMSQRDRDALGVHECLRHFNKEWTDFALTTAEIEAVTRFVMGSVIESDDLLIQSAKQKYQRALKARRSQIAKAHPENPGLFLKAYEEARQEKKNLLAQALRAGNPNVALKNSWSGIVYNEFNVFDFETSARHRRRAVLTKILFDKLEKNNANLRLTFKAANRVDLNSLLNTVMQEDQEYLFSASASYRGNLLCEGLSNIVKISWNEADSVISAKSLKDRYCQSKQDQQKLGDDYAAIQQVWATASLVANDGALADDQRQPGKELLFTSLSILQSL